MLRNRQTAAVTRRTELDAYELLGKDAENWPHLWREDGKWWEHGEPSPYDIVAVYRADGKAEPLTDQFRP